MIDLNAFRSAYDAEFERLFGGPPPTPDEWDAMNHVERSRVMAAQSAVRWNLDFHFAVDDLCGFTGLSRLEAMLFYFGEKSWDAGEWIRSLTPHAPEKEPWQQ